MDKVSSQKRSDIMSQVKSKETKLEKSFRKVLWSNGLRYRKNNSKLFGKPDLSLKGRKAVIFIDSCFWHGCVDHLRMPSSNINYWENKIAKNKRRDREVSNYYLDKDWTLIRIWEHDIKDFGKLQQICENIKLKLNG